MSDAMEKIVSLAKRRGFIYPDSEIYGGMANSWDYGPLGILLKNNIKREWWKFFVQQQSDMVGLDSSIIMNPKVWEASGHIQNFTDPLVECKQCHKRFRADHLLEAANGAEPQHEKEPIVDISSIHCPSCDGELTDVKQFNLMFKTHVGATEDSGSAAYLRPELAAGMFTNFKNVIDTMRARLPLGIAQQGRAFRNEITTGNFIFRTREFEIMEFEYFCHPKDWELHLERTVDIEYLYPFGQKELHGIAYRTDFDLKRHMEVSGVDLTYRDPITGEKFLPHVIEPTFGVDRMVLLALLEHYHEIEGGRDEETESKHEKEVILRLPKKLAPITVAILPLSKKEPLQEIARSLQTTLSRQWMTQYDETASIGKRYRRQDEIGTPYCVTVDFDSLEDKKVTVRDRDTMIQERIDITDVSAYVMEKMS